MLERVKIALFDTHPYDREYFTLANKQFGHELTFFEPRMTTLTAPLAKGFPCICCFVNDRLDEPTLRILRDQGVRLLALRCAGYNNVNLDAAGALGIRVVRVPAYSPHAVAEHAVALILALNRKTHKAYERVRELNFSLTGLQGFDLDGKTVGIIGTGRIGTVMTRIMNGFGCRVLAYDPVRSKEVIEENLATYVTLQEIYRKSDIISLHIPLLPETHHLINTEALTLMKPGVFIINTGRGALIDARALIDSLKSGQVGAAGLDVYEEEEGIFYENLSDQVLQDDVLARLLTFPNVLVTSHQAFLTREALTQIAEITLRNVSSFEKGLALPNELNSETTRP